MERQNFFALSLEIKLGYVEQWKTGEATAPKWVEDLLVKVQETYGVRIQMAFEVLAIMCSHDLLEEQAFEELLKQMNKRQTTNSPFKK